MPQLGIKAANINTSGLAVAIGKVSIAPTTNERNVKTMSAKGAAAVLLTMAGVGWLATVVAEAILLVTAGTALLCVAVAVVFFLGLIAYGKAAKRAIREQDYVWQTNIVLAPILASISVFLVHGVYSSWWNTLVSAGKSFTNSHNILYDFVALGLGASMLVSIIAAPIIAVRGMMTSNRLAHVASYIAFFYTASYWGMLLASWAGYPWGLSWN